MNKIQAIASSGIGKGWLLLIVAFVGSAEAVETLRLGSFAPLSIGAPAKGRPWITDLHIDDLDRDGLLDVLACDARLNQIVWIRQTRTGNFVEQPIGTRVAGPCHLETADLDGDGDIDVLVSELGSITPSNEHIGKVVVLENRGAGTFVNHVLAKRLPRVAYVGAADFDGDGDLDLSVGMFGYVEGAISWMENRGDWTFLFRPLLDYAGTIHAPPVDLDADGDMDIVALVSQDWEEVHAFINDGKGNFTGRILYGAGNRNFDSSGIEVGDIDQDGDPDIAFANGDGFDYPIPGPRPWHGVQWLENDGAGNFTYHRLGDMSGVYAPIIADLDGDGRNDIGVVSAFHDWKLRSAVSLACFRQLESGEFEFIPLAKKPTHLVSLDAADLDGDGQVELVTGGFLYSPGSGVISRVTLWSRKEGN